MPISAPNIVYFDNIPANHPSYVQVSANYLNKKIYCQATNISKNVKIFQKKWLLQTQDKQKEIESFSENIDFSLAKKFPIITCEAILYDGFLYKKEEKFFSEFVNWQNFSPAIKIYTLSNISEFSISNFFLKQTQNDSYFCESLTGAEYEQNFCSLIDTETGQIEKKNIDYKTFLAMLNNEKYRIFNLIVGVKSQNKILIKNNVKFVFDSDNKTENIKLPPIVQFIENENDYYLLCKSNNFLFYPNSEKYFWYINGKKIDNQFNISLPIENIKFSQNYSCETNNGISEKLTLNKKYLKIIGSNQIGISEQSDVIIEKYKTNIDLSRNNISWSCIGNENFECFVSLIDKSGIAELKLIKKEKLKINNSENLVTLKLQIDDELFEKNITIFNKSDVYENVKDISNSMSIALTANDMSYICYIPEEIILKSNYQIFWFIDENEVSKYRNSLLFNEKLIEGNLSCTIVGNHLNQPFIGTVVIKNGNLNEKNPSWLKESYLYNPNNNYIIRLFRDKTNSRKNALYCYVYDRNSSPLTDNICKKDKNGWYYISLSNLDLQKLNKYISDNEIIDVYNIENFPLHIRNFESNKVVDLKSSFRVVVPNYKPVILSSGLLNSGDLQKCYVIVKDPQNLFLSTKFTLDNNKISRSFSSFDNRKEIKNSNLFLHNKIFSNGVNLYEYTFHLNKKEDYCNIAINNGTQVSFIKAQTVSKAQFLLDIQESERREFANLKSINIINSSEYKKSTSQINLNAFEDIKVLPLKDNKIKESLKLKYLFYPKSSVLNVLYPSDIFFIKNTQEKISGENELNDVYKNNKFSDLFIATRLYQDTKNKKRFFCENTSHSNQNLNNIKYTIYLNSKTIQSKTGDTYGAFFDVDNYQENDTVSCQVDLGNIFERSSFNQADKSELFSFCYALDASKSVIRFECPSQLNFKRNSKELKNIMKDFIIKNFDNYKSIDYINISVSSLAEKNKFSISMNLKKLTEE